MQHRDLITIKKIIDEMSIGIELLGSQIPRSKLSGHDSLFMNLFAPRGGVFDPRGIRQMSMQACPFSSLLAGIKKYTGTI